jgi:hypothetical protein
MLTIRMLTIRLGAIDYRIPKFNIAQLRAIAEHAKGGSDQDAFEIVRIAISRAEPPVINYAALEPDLQQVRDAAAQILTFAGFK